MDSTSSSIFFLPISPAKSNECRDYLVMKFYISCQNSSLLKVSLYRETVTGGNTYTFDSRAPMFWRLWKKKKKWKEDENLCWAAEGGKDLTAGVQPKVSCEKCTPLSWWCNFSFTLQNAQVPAHFSYLSKKVKTIGRRTENNFGSLRWVRVDKWVHVHHRGLYELGWVWGDLSWAWNIWKWWDFSSCHAGYLRGLVVNWRSIMGHSIGH